MDKILIINSNNDQSIINSFIQNILIEGLEINSQYISNLLISESVISNNDFKKKIITSIRQSKLIIEITSSNCKDNNIFFLEGVVSTINKKDNRYCMCINMQQDNDEFEDSLEKQLDLLRDVVISKFEIDANKLKTDKWTMKKRCFIKDVNKIRKDVFKRGIKGIVKSIILKGMSCCISIIVKMLYKS